MMVPHPNLGKLRRWDPERIGPFALLGRLGAGAMGQVYLGRSQAGRLVAVKTIKIELAEEPGFRDHFAHEVAAARRVSGMFTAAVVAADPEADVPWLATTYVPVPSLSRLVRSCGPQPVPAVWWLAAGCAEDLESIHGAGLVHRDLKPSNVLVAPSGPLVIDFGVARAAERIALTVTRGAVGTPGYMAPEQARDSQQASLASDVYSLGATLLYAATGHAPYHGETVMDVLVKLATEPPDLTGLPPDLTGLINACLAHSPRDRPTSAKLLAGLGSFVEGSVGTAEDHNYLPDSAMTLIAGYQRSPQPGPLDTANDDPTHDEPTSASHTALPPQTPRHGPRHGPSSRPGTKQGNGRGSRPGSRPPGPTGSGPDGPRHEPGWGPSRGSGPGDGRARVGLIAAGCVAGAAVLIAGGAFLGPKVDPGLVSSTGSDPSSAPAQPGGPPPSTLPTGTSTTPKLLVNQPSGDPVTGFVIHGMGFIPDTTVNVALVGHGTSAWHPMVDPVGTFNYTIDQDHLFFRQAMPIGSYEVLVTGSDGRRATADFRVDPAPGPRPPGPPPTGQAPTGQPPTGAPPTGQYPTS
jgi:serine/threonine protein kinase